MRKRFIKKYGNTWIIKLELSDIFDYDLQEGDIVDVEDILKIKLKQEVKK